MVRRNLMGAVEAKQRNIGTEKDGFNKINCIYTLRKIYIYFNLKDISKSLKDYSVEQNGVNYNLKSVVKL